MENNGSTKDNDLKNKEEEVKISSVLVGEISSTVNNYVDSFKLSVFNALDNKSAMDLGIPISCEIGKKDIDSGDNEKDNNIKEYLYNIYKVNNSIKGEIDKNKPLPVDFLFSVMGEHIGDFLGRKLIFEHYIDEEIPEFKCFNPIEYNPKIDRCFEEFYLDKSLGIKQALLTIKDSSKTTEEIQFIFDIIFVLISSGKDIQEILRNSISIMNYFKNKDDNLKDVVKSIELTLLLGEEIKETNIEKNMNLVTFYINFTGSNFGKEYRSVEDFIKDVKLHESDLLQGIGKMKFSKKEDKEEEIKEDKKNNIGEKITNVKNKIISYGSKQVSKMFSFIMKQKDLLGEALLGFVLRFFRNKKTKSKTILSEKEHSDLIKKQLHQQEIIKGIGTKILNVKSRVKKKDINFVFREIRKRTKIQTEKMVAGQVLFLVEKIFGSKYLLKYIGKVRKITQIGLYLLIDYSLKQLGKTDLIRRGKIIHESRDGYSLSESPEILNFISKNFSKLSEKSSENVEEFSNKFADLLENEGRRLNNSFLNYK